MAPSISESSPISTSYEAQPNLAPKLAQEVLTDHWPASLSGDSVWQGYHYKDPLEYTYDVTADDLKEVEAALQLFKDLELDGHEITRENFKLPTLGAKLLDSAKDLHNARGFFVIRGINPKKYTMEDNVLMFLGISTYIGEKRGKQDHHGSMLVHLKHDKNLYPTPGLGPSLHTNKASPYHTEFFCDLMAFQVRSCPASGGFFKATSAANLYNKLRLSYPDVVEVLAQPNWQFQGRGKLFPGHRRAILYFHAGRAIFDFSTRPLVNLTSEQKDALATLQIIAANDELFIVPQLGDIMFVNNHAVLHARTNFEDDEQHVRHIVRMWLRNESLAWSLPHALRQGNLRIYENEDMVESWSLDYVPTVQFPWMNSALYDTSH